VTSRIVRMVTERSHRDDENRPLREGRTPSEFLHPDDIEYKPCPYSGPRLPSGKPMNVSALRQTTTHWDEILEALAVLRSAYVQARRGASDQPDLMDLWRISQLGSALPWWFILRGEPLPGYAAALSKATLGVGIWAQQMLMKELAGAWTEPIFTASIIGELAEESGSLIGAKEVCSGSEKMLVRFFEVYLESSPGTGSLATSRDDILRFGAHYANFKLVMWIYFSARRYLLAEVGTPAALELMNRGAEPPDFFILEPPGLAKIPPEMRKVWFTKLAKLVVPFAAYDSDAEFASAALQIADVMGQRLAPADAFAALDLIFLDVVKQTEAGLGGEPGEITSATTDSLIASGTRALFTGL
jgi:hypothetical protein